VIVDKIKIYDLEESIEASKYPMAIDTDSCTSEITNTTIKLGNSPRGSAHDNFLHGILVAFDLTFTVKAWTEAERYHFFEIISSQSTMHRISKFELINQYIEYVDPRIIVIMEELKNTYNQTKNPEDYLRLLYSNPCGFRLTARMSTNYGQLKTIYNQRNTHRLPEWREFCKWILTLPNFIELTGVIE
jgi:hypothetical protein